MRDRRYIRIPTGRHKTCLSHGGFQFFEQRNDRHFYLMPLSIANKMLISLESVTVGNIFARTAFEKTETHIHFFTRRSIGDVI